MNEITNRAECGKVQICWSGNQHGFLLMEVLIALLVLMVGLLGVAGMQAISLNNNHSAYLRSQANVQAHEMADRIWPASPQKSHSPGRVVEFRQWGSLVDRVAMRMNGWRQ